MDFDVKLLRHKICHPVEEIRVRSLNSLLYKLEQSLIEPEVLSTNKNLHISLLNSLGYEGTGHHQALAILDKLSVTKESAKILLDVDGVNILGTAKEKDNTLEKMIEKITDRILYISNNEAAEETATDCSTTDITVETTATKADATPSMTSTNTFSPNLGSERNASMEKTLTVIFPAVNLDEHDQSILTRLTKRISEDEEGGEMCLRSCEFLRDVLLQDYPTEVFLQHPEVVLRILKLLQETPVRLVSRETDLLVLDTVIRLVEALDRRVSLFTKNWVDTPKWNRPEGKNYQAEMPPSLALPKFVFLTLKYILPVFIRCEDDSTSAKLLSYLKCVTILLSTLNAAPVSFNIATNHLSNMFGLLGDTTRSVFRRWNKTNLISAISPALLTGMVSFSINFTYNFIPSSHLVDYLPAALLDVYKDLYANPVFYVAHRVTHKMVEKIILEVDSSACNELSRVQMMMVAMETSVIERENVTPRDLQTVFDGLEVLVHFPNDNLLQLVLNFFLTNTVVDEEVSSNGLVWCMSNSIINDKVYGFLASHTASNFMLLHKDVLWEMCVHGLHGSTSLQLSTSHILNNTLTKLPSCSPNIQLKFYRSLYPSLFFLVSALSHCSELRTNVLDYLTSVEHLMTEMETIKIWLSLMLSREESLRLAAMTKLSKWAAAQGFMVRVESNDLVVADTFKTMITFNLVNGIPDTAGIEKLKLIAFNTSLKEDLRGAAFQQLAVLLSDGATSKVFSSLHVTIALMLAEVDIQSEMLLPMLRCFRHLIHHNDDTRRELSSNPEVYGVLLRAIGNLSDLDKGFKVDRDVKAEVSTVIMLLLTQEFSHPSFWSGSSYYAMYRVVLPECLCMGLHLPCHMTTLPLPRPTPPPILSSTWLPWLQFHFYIACAGSVDAFIKSCKHEDVPTVQASKECLQKMWYKTNLNLLDDKLLLMVSDLGYITKDADLDALISKELSENRVSSTHFSPHLYKLISRFNVKLCPNFVGTFLSNLEDTLESKENTDLARAMLELYSASRHIQRQLSSKSVFFGILKLYKAIQNVGPDNLQLSQVTSKALAISSFKVDLQHKERIKVEEFLVQQIDTISYGRGDVTSFMGAEILRNLFCALSNLNSVDSNTIDIKWIIQWVTDKDPVVRSCCFSLHFIYPECPLTSESAAVLAVSCFSDNTELYTVRQQSLYLLSRLVGMLVRGEGDKKDSPSHQGLTLLVLVLKRLEFYNSCVSYVTELQHVLEFSRSGALIPSSSSSQMISTFFEDVSGDTQKWDVGLTGLFYILDAMLDVNILLCCTEVLGVNTHVNTLLTPLQQVFSVNALKSIIMFQEGSSALEAYVSAFSKTLRLMTVSGCKTLERDFLGTVVGVIALESELKLVLDLKQACLRFIKAMIHVGVAVPIWDTLLPSFGRYLGSDVLRLPTLNILYTLLSRGDPELIHTLSRNKDVSLGLCDTLFGICAKMNILSRDPGDLMVVGVVGLLSQHHPPSQSNFIDLGVLDLGVQAITQVDKHIQAIRLACPGKENAKPRAMGKPRKGKTKKGGILAESDILELAKAMSCVVYMISGCTVGSTSAPRHLLDLGIIPIFSHIWSLHSSNILLINSILKFLSVMLDAGGSPVFKEVASERSLLGHVVDAAKKAVQFSTHPLTSLKAVLFETLCVVGRNDECLTFIWKSGLISLFPKLEEVKADPSKAELWAKFFVHVGYSTFGRNNLLSIPHIMDVLLVLPGPYKCDVLMILRSLVMNSKLHPKLFANEKFLGYLLDGIVPTKVQQTVLVLQILYSLILLSNKAKSLLRCSGSDQALGKLDLFLKKRNEASISNHYRELLLIYE